jgi:hypothetical protein
MIKLELELCLFAAIGKRFSGCKKDIAKMDIVEISHTKLLCLLQRKY